jgi:hypothetical protein
MSKGDTLARRALLALGVVLVLVVTALVYRPGLEGPLLFDDVPNILEAPRLEMETLDAESVKLAVYAAQVERPYRGLAMLTFALNYYVSGGVFVPLHMKITNVGVHMAAGMLLFWLSRRLARRVAPPASSRELAIDGADALALMVTAIWLLHPLQLTGVLYVVQRMTSLSALLVLAGLVAYVAGRERVERGQGGGLALMLSGVVGGVGVGVLAKENAALLPAFAALVEFFFFSREGLPRGTRRAITILHGLFVGLPAVAAVALLLLRFDLVEATYTTRDFGPWERLLTQARVLFDYLRMIALPRLSAFGLFHDDVVVSRGLLSPPTTVLAVVAWTVVAATTVVGLRRRAGWAFGIAWFLVGHAMESTFIGLEMVYEHRNYLPLAGLLLGLAISVRRAIARAAVDMRAIQAVCLITLGLLSFLTHTRADIWSSEKGLMAFTATVHPRSYRAASYVAMHTLATGATIEEIYASWAVPARLSGSDHTALMELIKVLSIAEAGAEKVSAQGCSAVAPGRVTIPETLPTDARCVRALRDALVVEMHRRAAEAPIPPTTLSALEHFGGCVMAGVEYCVPLAADVETWVRAVLEGGRMPVDLRPRLMLLLANLRVTDGDRDEALRLAEEATRDSGHAPSFTSQLVAVYLALGQPHKARLAIDLMLDPRHWRAGNDLAAREMLHMVENHERQSAR